MTTLEPLLHLLGATQATQLHTPLLAALAIMACGLVLALLLHVLRDAPSPAQPQLSTEARSRAVTPLLDSSSTLGSRRAAEPGWRLPMTGLISLAALGALVLLARRPTSLVADQPALDDRSALRVQCLASRYAWSFRYAGSDGEFGTIDDIVHPQLVVPHRGRIVLQLRSNDVLHGLAIPRLGLRRTVVPGLTVTLAFDLPPEPATRTAHSACAWPLVYEIACSELCGTSHHRMRSELVIHDTPGFARWLAAARASREPPATTVPSHPPANPSPVNLPTAHPARDTVLVDSTARTNWGWPWPASR